MLGMLTHSANGSTLSGWTRKWWQVAEPGGICLWSQNFLSFYFSQMNNYLSMIHSLVGLYWIDSNARLEGAESQFLVCAGFRLGHLSSPEVMMGTVNSILKTRLRFWMDTEMYMWCLIILMDLQIIIMITESLLRDLKSKCHYHKTPIVSYSDVCTVFLVSLLSKILTSLLKKTTIHKSVLFIILNSLFTLDYVWTTNTS